MRFGEATSEQLLGWDRYTVDPPGGNVYQSRAWAEQRSRLGWRPRFLVSDDGYRLLSLERPWRLVPGAGAYLSRGPISAGEPAQRTAERLAAAAEWLFEHGVDVVASDAEIPADTGYGTLIETGGFRPIEEVQPSRHRLALDLHPGEPESTYFAGFSETTRQLIRQGEKAGLRVVRWDRRGPGSGAFGEGFDAPAADADPAAAFERLYGLLEAAAARRHFGLGSQAGFSAWSLAGLEAGMTVLLEVRTADGELLGAATFYRHGGRLTYSHSGDRADLRRTYPGVARLLLWRAIQLAVREERIEVDLAGVDVRGARREPAKGEEMRGLYEFKRSFGARWIELTGNHERIARPWRYGLGRISGRLLGFRR
ncbi:MAG TPA: GNAT family N-acetyltransferase [Candidatus Limnocylindrales bacterium]|jgi:lipid II:glycine glycyltransferase (peptidoglycan interpeptide bridge formation enzyme)